MNISTDIIPHPVPAFSTQSYLRAILVGALLLALYFPTIKGLVFDWRTHNDYSHGLLIPFLSLFVLWRRRKELTELSYSPSKVGLGLFVLGLLICLGGRIGVEEFLERVSLPLTLFGLTYAFLGIKGAKLTLFPIAYLYLMIPPPYSLFQEVALNLRLLDARAVAIMASWVGVPVLREAYLIHLPEISLEVADGCSGAFSSMALLGLGIFYIHELKRPAKVFLWLILIPIAIFSNIIRIFIIVVVTYSSGRWILESNFHKLSGTFNFLLGFGALIFISEFLERYPRLRQASR